MPEGSHLGDCSGFNAASALERPSFLPESPDYGVQPSGASVYVKDTMRTMSTQADQGKRSRNNDSAQGGTSLSRFEAFVAAILKVPRDEIVEAEAKRPKRASSSSKRQAK